MQRRAHPFFSRLGCTAALLVILALAAFVYARGGAPFNAGPLSDARTDAPPPAPGRLQTDFASHAQFEQDCSRCHVPWRGVRAQRCETCHVGVAAERRAGDGLHGLLGDTGDCTQCHTEHQGRTASLTLVSADNFDHAQTGFSLVRHDTDYDGSELNCVDCHVDNAFSAERVDCVTCHTTAEPAFMDEHVALFGAACLDCHDGVDRMADFNHDAVFALEGAHATIACSECHIGVSLQETPRQCVGCHAEPAIHAGLFGLGCERCHSVEAWTPAELTEHTFPLDHGEEGVQACAVCHGQSFSTYNCYNCHEHEPEEIREEHLDEGIRAFEDCVACHPTGREDEAEE